MKDFRDDCSMLVLEGEKNRIVDVLMMSVSEDVDRNLTHKKKQWLLRSHTTVLSHMVVILALNNC